MKQIDCIGFLLGFISVCFYLSVHGNPLKSEHPKFAQSIDAGRGTVFVTNPTPPKLTSSLALCEGWCVATGYAMKKERAKALGIDLSGDPSSDQWASFDIQNQLDPRPSRWTLQTGLESFVAQHKSRYWFDSIPEGQTSWSDSPGAVARIGQVATVDKGNGFERFSGRGSPGMSNVGRLNIAGTNLLVKGVESPMSSIRVKTQSASVFVEEDLIAEEAKRRRQATTATVFGGIVTGLAVATNVLAVREYHSSHMWARLGGVSALAISHFGLTPVGTGLLILGSLNRSKARALRQKIGAEGKK